MQILDWSIAPSRAFFVPASRAEDDPGAILGHTIEA
jgi:hypothetical protein